MVVYEHQDEDCPYVDQMKKLKSEIKRLRQELILKPNPKKRNEDDVEGFTDEEQRAVRMLTSEQRKCL